MTEQQIRATLDEMTKLLANNLTDILETARGPKTIQIVQRQLCTLEDLKSSDLLVAKAADDMRSYLAAWPNVNVPNSPPRSTPLGRARIYHREELERYYAMPVFNVYHASAPTSTGRVEALLFWNNEVLSSELAFVLTCPIRA